MPRAFLPYTFKSRLPSWPWLVRLYLALPPAQWFFGKQMFLVARRDREVCNPDRASDGNPDRANPLGYAVECDFIVPLPFHG